MRQTLFGWLAGVIARRRAWIIGITLAVFLVMLVPLRQVRFSTDVLELIPQELETLQTFREIDRHFVQGGDIAVLIELPTQDAATLESFQHEFLEEVQSIPGIA